MEFLKKNYEKVLLALVLFGLVVAAAFLPFRIASEKDTLNALKDKKFDYPIDPLPDLKTNRYELAIRRASKPVELDLSSTNKLVNPVRWLKGPDNRPIKMPVGEELKQLEITRVSPLYLIISLDSVNVTESGARYVISVEQQAAPRGKQGRRANYMSVGEKKELFTLRSAQGPVELPTGVVLELNDSGEQITISRERPYRKVEGYMTDLRYSPEGKSFPMRRVGDKILVSGEEYNIVAITENEVVLSARSNGKKYTIRTNAAT